jgi:hypothetical protein
MLRVHLLANLQLPPVFHHVFVLWRTFPCMPYTVARHAVLLIAVAI